MCCRRGSAKFPVAPCVLFLIGLGMMPPAPVAGQGLLRLDGPVVFPVAGASGLKDIPLRDGTQFGAFQGSDRSEASQESVKYWLKQVEMPSGGKMPFFTIYYNCSKTESFCGLWLKLGNADWRPYQDGVLVFRLRRFPPLNEAKVFDPAGREVPDTECVSDVKVELKSLRRNASGEPKSFGLRSDFGFVASREQQSNGYFDLRVPIRGFGLGDDLSSLDELALIFENRAAMGRTRGNLGIQAIFLERKDRKPPADLSIAGFAAEASSIESTAEVSRAPPAPRVTKPVTLNGPMLIQFANPLNALRVPRTQFGIFRDENPRTVQFIEERWETKATEHQARPVGFLALNYEVPLHYNGWFLKLHGADWTAYKNGLLVLRVRPGLDCTPVFKVELKRTEGGLPSYVYVRLQDRHLQLAKQVGYVDLPIPLSAFSIGDLSKMEEFVIVFESDRIPRANRKGTLLIESIRLAVSQELNDGFSQLSLIDDLGWLAHLWFEDARHPETGMVLDRLPNWLDRGKRTEMSSIASTGYYLSLLPEWVRLGYLTREQAEQRAIQTLDFISSKLEGHRGLYYHFCDQATGKRFGKSEVSTLDSAILLNGCACCSVFFGGRIAELADGLLDKAEWDAYVVEHPKTGKRLLALGWSPEKNLLSGSDVRSSEMAMSLFLAVGSRTHPVDAECWYNTMANYGDLAGYRVLNPRHPHFTSYYGLGWHDLKGRVDRDDVDLWANAKAATLGNREFCRRYGKQLKTYSEASANWWGISAGDSPEGYVAAAPVWGEPDGTVWPLTALAALPWVPEELEADLSAWRKSEVWSKVCGQYGLSPFNLERPDERTEFWIGQDLIGIDIGSFAVSLANHRNGTVWNLWNKHPIAKASLAKIGFEIP